MFRDTQVYRSITLHGSQKSTMTSPPLRGWCGIVVRLGRHPVVEWVRLAER